MTAVTLQAELESAMARGEAFGSPDRSRAPQLEVPAEVLKRVLTGWEDDGDAALLWLSGARIVGYLNLESVRLNTRLRLEYCEIEKPVNLRQVEALDIEMRDCRLHGKLLADQIAVRWNLVLDRSKCEKGISLIGARIGGWLSLAGADCRGSAHLSGRISAVEADRIEIAESLFAEALNATGEVRLGGAKIGGRLLLSNAQLAARKDEVGEVVALDADGISVDSDMFCEDRFTVHGGMRMVGAKIGGRLSLNGATLISQEGRYGERDSLSAARMEVSEGVYFENLTVEGRMTMIGAKIGSRLSMDGTSLRVEGGEALGADGIEVTGSVFCRDGFTANGEVRLVGARVARSLSMRGAVLGRAGPDSTALSTDGIEVGGSMFFHGGFEATGEVRLLGSTIGGLVAMHGATLVAEEDVDGAFRALGADGIEVGGSVALQAGFDARGEVRLVDAKVGGLLVMKGATLRAIRGRDGTDVAFNGDGVEVARDLVADDLAALGEVRMAGVKVGGRLGLGRAKLEATAESEPAMNLRGAAIDELALGFSSIEGAVDLRQAEVRSLWDTQGDAIAGQQPDDLRLDGFKYRSLREPLDAKRRLAWIEPSQRRRYYPGVYVELADAFRRIGHDEDARKVAIASERRAREQYSRFHPRRILGFVLWVTIGYGYRNWRALGWLVALLVMGSVAFCLGEDSFVPKGTGESGLIVNEPAFNPLLYAVDVTVPFVEVDQQRAWAPTDWLVWLSLVLTIAGYALATAVIAAAAGLLNRDHR